MMYAIVGPMWLLMGLFGVANPVSTRTFTMVTALVIGGVIVAAWWALVHAKQKLQRALQS
jgi:hypothetical protein